MPRHACRPRLRCLGVSGESTMGSIKACEADWGMMPAPPLEELLKDLSIEEQVRVQNDLRERERNKRCYKNLPQPPQMRVERERMSDNCITDVARHAIRHYNAKHPGGEFDAVKSLMESTVLFRGVVWFHINFWARSRSSNKIKRFFAEVHYKDLASSCVPNPPIEVLKALKPRLPVKPSASSCVCSDQPVSVPEAEVHHKQPASRFVFSFPPIQAPKAELHDRAFTRSSVCSDQPVSVPEAEVNRRLPASSSVCSDQAAPVPKAEVHDWAAPSSSLWSVPNEIAIVEVCTIIEEPLGRYRRSCAFCRGPLDIFHPRGSRKFVCGNDKDRMVQQFHFSRRKTGRGLSCPLTT